MIPGCSKHTVTVHVYMHVVLPDKHLYVGWPLMHEGVSVHACIGQACIRKSCVFIYSRLSVSAAAGA